MFASVLVVLFFGAPISAAVEQLTTATFEHQTQAATGQTTGIWLVHFQGGDGCVPCKHIAEAIEEYNPDGNEEVVIMAQVDVLADAVLATRFAVHETPTLLLFRDRKMYRHASPLELASSEQPLEDILAFVAAAGKGQLKAEEVPAVPGPFDDWLKQAQHFLDKHLEGGAGQALGLAVAGVGLLVVVVVVVLLLAGKPKAD